MSSPSQQIWAQKFLKMFKIGFARLWHETSMFRLLKARIWHKLSLFQNKNRNSWMSHRPDKFIKDIEKCLMLTWFSVLDDFRTFWILTLGLYRELSFPRIPRGVEGSDVVVSWFERTMEHFVTVSGAWRSDCLCFCPVRPRCQPSSPSSQRGDTSEGGSVSCQESLSHHLRRNSSQPQTINANKVG